MRVLLIFIVTLSAACAADDPGNPPVSTFEVDARGASGVVDQRWMLQGLGRPIGVVLSAVRCANTLFVNDANGGVRRLRLNTGETLPTLASDTFFTSLAIDCPGGIVYGFGPSPRKSGRPTGNVLRAYAVDTGEPSGIWPLNTLISPAVAGVIFEGQFVVGGLWMPLTDRAYAHPPAPEFYKDKKIGLTVDLANGTWSAPFTPYEIGCRGGGRCAGGSLWPLEGEGPERWIAAQPSSRHVAFYDGELRLVRTVDVSSPMFKSDGQAVEVDDAAASMHWSASNTLVRMAIPINGMVATVHSLVRLPSGYVFGQSVEFDWWLNLHDIDGHGLVSDIRIPG